MEAFTVAIVDDDAAIRRLVRLFLRRSGYDILECTTGEEAREALWNEPWDLAVLDRRLPDLDGGLVGYGPTPHRGDRQAGRTPAEGPPQRARADRGALPLWTAGRGARGVR